MVTDDAAGAPDRSSAVTLRSALGFSRKTLNGVWTLIPSPLATSRPANTPYVPPAAPTSVRSSTDASPAAGTVTEVAPRENRPAGASVSRARPTVTGASEVLRYVTVRVMG